MCHETLQVKTEFVHAKFSFLVGLSFKSCSCFKNPTTEKLYHCKNQKEKVFTIQLSNIHSSCGEGFFFLKKNLCNTSRMWEKLLHLKAQLTEFNRKKKITLKKTAKKAPMLACHTSG